MCEIFWASSLSHNNLTELGRGKDFSVHKLGHALSARFGVTHGASLAAVWGAWANYLYEDCIPRFARYARRVWGMDLTVDKTAAELGIEKTVGFFRSIGMPTNLHELGVDTDDGTLHALALNATMNGTLKLSRIRPLGAAEVEDIFRAAK